MKITAVIMAGGRGERFWPKSRTNYPKQFLSLTEDGETMIQKTVKRLLPIVAIEDIFVVTNVSYAALVQEQLPSLPAENVLTEPCARNTAPCIGLAAAVIRKKYGEAMMLVLPSDHLIRYEEMYIDTLRQAVAVAEKDENLVTIGITPTYPETGYGYINFARDTALEMPGVYRVERFVEKPDLETAKEYLASHRYLWNSGMFVWKTSSILANIQKLMPDIYDGLTRIEAAVGTADYESVLEAEYQAFRSESIDFGVMEKAENIYTLPGSFGWDDVGNWLAVERINATNEYGNYIEGDVITIGTERSTICGGKRLIAAVGIENLIVVDTDDAVLICAKDSTQDVKKVIENLKICNRNQLV
ncbi:mannose-1-phosphate guanylyltransferase [Ruminococcus sp.]|uniref:mannose-1-phosphate guanylyltransferase n=1 Tax=Ruminococcus sp. TaxID=41978 RepID=UPI0025F727EA|nr:mannose-1-phosphate guanylyltransferase [Ruminococcus sp.]